MKKILLISNMYPSERDEIYGIFVKNFKLQMEKGGFKLEKSVIEGRGVNNFDKIVKYFKFFFETIKIILKNNYDVIYVHYIGHSLLPIALFRRAIKKPIIVNAHGSDVLSKNKLNQIIKKLIKPIVENANLVVIPSMYFKNILLDQFQIQEEKLFISSSGGINRDIFQKLSTTNKNKIFTIGYVSRIDNGKGWSTLLLAINLLVKQGSISFKVLIIGGGPEESLLKNMIIDLQLEYYIKFVGKVPQSELVNYYNMMDIFAFTTLAESLGLVGIEAMSCGVPVIGSNIGGVKGYVYNGYNGALFDVGNEFELKNKLDFFLNLNKDELMVYSQNALKTAKKYDSRLVMNDMKNKINEIIYSKI